jgi:peptidoglycan/xylan/chitin deacetylase (PgdA/CDA1 family)
LFNKEVHSMNTDDFRWPDGQRCAVSLTYDDGLSVHCEYVGPALVEAGLRATFYLPGRSDFLLHHPEKWRELAEAGHELGNHSLFHPCRREPGRHDWLEPYYDLCDYTPSRLRQELEIANLVLHLIDSRRERTYGNTCCDTTIGRGEQEVPMDDVLRDLFVAARGPGSSRIADVRGGINLMQVGHYGADSGDMSFEYIMETIERSAEMGGWAVFMIHGVGKGSYHLYMETSTHGRLVSWLDANKADVWTAPLVEVAKCVRNCQKV